MLIGSLCSGYGGLDLAAEAMLDADPHLLRDLATTP